MRHAHHRTIDAPKPNGYVSGDIQPGDTIRYGSWTDHPESDSDQPITLFPYSSGSDYSGNTVEISNYQVLAENPDVMEHSVLIQGGHGSFGIAYFGEPTEEILELVASLQSYPLLDEDHHSNLEMELEWAAWLDHGRADFKRELFQAFDDTATDGTSALTDELLTEALLDRTWRNFADNHGDGGKVFEQGDSCHFYIDACIEWLRETRHRGTMLVLGHVEYRDHLSVILDAFEEGAGLNDPRIVAMLKGWDDVTVIDLTPRETFPDGDSLGGSRGI